MRYIYKAILSLVLMSSGFLFAQTYNMTNGTINTCSGNFYDSGGAAGSYLNGENFTLTICSTIAGQSPQLNFSAFSTEGCCDFMTIYNGPNTASPIIGTYAGITSPGIVTGTGSCITIVFTSDGSITSTGWAAAISCVTPPPPSTNYNMSNGSISACTGTFYDPGGTGNYGNSQNFTYTICPSTPGSMVQVNFTTFALENSLDFLTIYNGNTTGAPSLGTYTGTAGPGLVQATPGNPTGCLTFVFTTDGSVTLAGWVGAIACIAPCQTITANITSTVPAPITGVVKICAGQSVTFNGNGTFSNSGVGATYTWNFGDGTTATGTSVSHVYATPGSYSVGLTITDPSGCTNNNSAGQIVQVSTNPTITTAAAPSPICLGQSSNLSATVTMIPYVPNCTPPVSGTTFLPDGSGVSYQTAISVNCFNSGQTVSSAADISGICLTMEHSYIGDLELEIICPNGQSMILKPYPGGSNTYLGAPLDDPAVGPGVGALYCFTPGAATLLVNGPTILSGTPASPSITPGNYMPSDPWSDLIGCPLNGNWTIQVTDNLGADNGYIFNWDVNFTVPPAAGGFTPTIASQGWLPTAGLTSTGATTSTVTPTAAGSTCYTYSVTDNFGCTNTAVQCVTVTNAPIMTSPATATICSGGTVNIPLTSTMAGSTYTWVAASNTSVTGESTTLQTSSTINNTLVNTTTGVETVTYTVTPTNGCVGIAQTVTVTINPPPLITAEPDLTFCAGAVVPLNAFVSTPAGATFTWTNSNVAIGLAASGTGSVPVFNATNSTGAAIASTITVIPTLAGCVGVAEVYTITVNPAPVMTSPSAVTICSGTAVNIPLTSNIGATYTWIAASNGSVTGESFTTLQTTSSIINTLTNTTTANQNVVYTVTPTSTPGGCVGAPQTVTVTVSPKPTMVSANSATICSGGTVNIPLLTNIAGSTFSWIAADNTNVTGESTSIQTANTLNNTPTNNTSTSQIVVYTVTPTFGLCAGNPQTVNVTVNPLPVITAEPDLTFCAGAAVPANPFVSTPAGATFAWTNSNTAIGLGANGTVSVPVFTATNATAAAITSTITITPTIGTCVGPVEIYTITVNPLPVITAEPDLTFCAGAAVPLNSFVTVPAGATFAWTNSNTAIGLAASGTADVPAFTATNATAAAITSTITITPTLGTCAGPVEIYTITVNPLPVITAEPDLIFCAGAAVPLNSFVSTPPGATFAWTNSNTTIGLAANGTVSVPAFAATNATAAAITSTITVTPTLGTCVGPVDVYTITVNPTPTVTDPADQTICAGGPTNAVNFTGTAGTTFNWVNSNTTIGLAASGTGNIAAFTAVNGTGAPVTATITVTPVLGACTGASQTFTITVNPNPIIAVSGVSPTACAGTNGTITITGLANSTAYNVSYTDDGVPVGPIALTSNGAGAITITGLNAGSYTNFIVALGACTSTSATIVVLVDPAAPTVTDPADQTLCASTNTTAVNFTGTAGATFNWTNNTPSIGLAASGTGNIASFPATNAGATPVTATITVTPSLAGCVGTPQTFTITVNPIATANANVDQAICAGGTITLAGAIGGSATSSTWSAPTGAFSSATSLTSTYTPSIASGTVTLTLTTNDPAGPCNAATDVMIVTVNPVPVIAVSGVSPTSCGGTNGTITITGLSNSTVYNVSYTDDGTPVGPISLTSNGAGAITITGLNAGSYTNFVAALGACSSASATVVVLVDPAAPTVTDPADQTLCANTNTTAVNFTGTAGATFNWTNTTPSIGLAASGTGNIAAFAATNAGATPVTATITVTPSLAGCVGTPQTFTITVNPIPTVTDPTDQSLCANATTNAVNFAGSTGATFNWTNTNTTIGLAASGTGNIAAFTALNPTPGTTANATITVTPVLNGCNGTPQTFTISVINTLPTLTCPGNLTAVCSITEQPAYASFAAFTGAGGTASSIGGTIQSATFTLVSEVSNGGTCPEIVTRTYSIQDNCGSTATCTQTITIDDNINPTGTAPAAITVQCVAAIPAADITLITDEADNCATPTVTFISDVSNGATCPEIITRTYRITDACGNFIDVAQTITVDDTTNPTASNPAAFNGSAVPAVDITVVTDEADNCSVPVVAFVSDVTDGLNCPETITRTYSVTDACGNQILVTQTITIGDPFPPTASNPAPIAVQCTSLIPAANPAVVTDEADNNGLPVVAFVSDASNGATCPEIITRTYSVTDDCGNQILVTQTITVDDTTNPTASNPAPVAVQCIADVPASDPNVINDEADNCSVPVVAFVSDVSNGGTCPEIITRTYSVTDACGNQILVTQTITVDDTTNPTASNPAPVTVQCIADVPASDPAVVTDEADNCSVPAVAFVSDVSNGATCPEIITRTYSVTDACGNQIVVTQTITVDDTTNPTASNPAALTVPGGPVPAADPAVVIDEADNCSVPVVAFVSDVTDGNLCPETITRTYSVTDACGNQILVTQTILITDPIMPTASNPAAVNVECIGDVPASDITVVTDEADNNGVPVIAFVSDVSDGLSCPETITRTYSVTDACANQILVTQLIIVDDVTNPTASNPAPITVQCIDDVPASDITLVTDEADNCIAAPLVAFVSDASNGATCPEIITRTYSVTDACGNQILVTQTITVDDTTDPTASNPALVIVECIADVPASDPTVVTDEADNCSVPTVLFVSDVSDGNTCPEIITRTYSVTDACGNQILVTQTIFVDDTTDPTASNPATVIVPGGPVPAVDPTVVIDEADNCSVPLVAFVSDVTDGNLCPETITRTYSVTDDCGNQIQVTQTIQITDPIMPTASNPVSINVECIGDVPASDITVVTDEADNNGVPVVAFVSDVSDGLTCPETITRTYSVTDACSNQILVTQQIIVNDITNPTASNPIAINVQCIGDVPASDITVVTDEADNCTAAPIVAFVSDASDGLTCPETITRTYSITDDCGNQTLVTQTIVVDDTTNPTASNPTSVTVECIGDVPASDITVVTDEADNCSVPTVLFVSDVSDGNTCPETITRTYSVTDACGNQILVTQSIIVNDTTNPTASNPAGVTVDIIANVPAADPLVVIDEADNCSVPTVLFVSDVSDGNTCPETITRTYSVTDACGNQITVTQTIIVSDIIMPTASNPITVNVECIGDVPAADITVVSDEADNGGVPVVAFVSDVSDGLSCPETITRTYSVTDDCANQILVTQQVIVNDITNPTATNPVAVNVQCIGDVPASDISVVTDEADNCTVAPVVAFVSDVSNGATCPEIITRTYSVTDDCGNQILVTQTITVDDTTNPTASNPASITVECIGDVPAANTSVVTDEADNCSVPVVAFVSDVSNGGSCPEIITRTYSVTDACGNQILVTQTITVSDITNPTASNPAPINVSCALDVPMPNINVVTDEADNCAAAPLVAHVSDVSDGNICNNETITRTYSITDNCGNSITVSQQIIIGVVTPSVSAGTDQAVCDGVQVTLTASNPNAAVITWDNGVTNGSAFNAPVGTTTYTVTATQCGGECFATDQVDVTVYPLPVVSFEGDSLIGCSPMPVNFTNLTSPAGANCAWNFGDGNSTLGCDSVFNIFDTPGAYDVTLTVTSNEGCTSSATYADYITVIVPPTAEFIYSPGYVAVSNTEVQFENLSENADDYLWDFGDGTGSLQTSPAHAFPVLGNMTYTVSLIATNFAGCADTATALVTISDELIFYVPNIFTPDGNSINNTFFPVFTAGYDVYDYHLTIFNRWGEVVFESYNAAVGWDGSFADQGLVEDGVYIWQIEFGETMSDKRHKERGHVTVLK
ncbi:MAG: PKD domain-containing protein [Crocinitomicaceae bacterium]|nr:PKD domain-containing protein [Crocinitomicaceae bacterium]